VIHGGKAGYGGVTAATISTRSGRAVVAEGQSRNPLRQECGVPTPHVITDAVERSADGLGAVY
jgi:hypothetical protein